MIRPFRCTYRLQLGPDLGFADARRLVPYLRDLGVSHLYLSPVLQARAGSTHGYDVVDPRRVSEELGGEAELRRLCEAGLGVVLDVVPNHMAASDENPFWRDPALRRRFFDLDEATGRHRRFFDIDALAGVRVEDPAVFEETHRLVLRLVREGLADGLRIDHLDGLADPAGYLRRLRERGVRHVWAEKILEPGEQLRDWPVEGTTGYEFANDATALCVDPAGERALTELQAELTGERRPFAELAAEAKLEQVGSTFAPEVERLRRLWDAPGLERSLASLPVYRTYVEPSSGRVEGPDRRAVEAAGMPGPLAEALLLERRAPEEFVTRFQQTSGSVMAKGVEDTACYRDVRLVCLNEVGGDPDRFSLPVEEFHRGNARRGARFPLHLLASQTHDTKRGGDVRARIGALAGIAGDWCARVRRWLELTERHREGGAPDRREQLLLLQTLVGAWPISSERLEGYLEKALREAKLTTSWIEPNELRESRVRAYCRRLLADRAFLDDFEPFAERVARAGERASLAQLALRLTAPGLPDVYQGDELWSLNLVDPDNRRPVDWGRRRAALEELRHGAAPERETAKLHLLVRCLELRARRPGAFAGAYTPLEAGPAACAYLRGGEILVVASLRGRLPDERLELPAAAAGRWLDVLDGRVLDLRGGIPVAELLSGAPAAVLERVVS